MLGVIADVLKPYFALMNFDHPLIPNYIAVNYYIMQHISILEHDRPSRRDLSNHVLPSVANNWKALGEMLLNRSLVDNGHLETIETNNPGNVTNCCRQMFIKWLETDKKASWKQLIMALQCPGVQLTTVAEQIERKIQKSKVIVS